MFRLLYECMVCRCNVFIIRSHDMTWPSPIQEIVFRGQQSMAQQVSLSCTVFNDFQTISISFHYHRHMYTIVYIYIYMYYMSILYIYIYIYAFLKLVNLKETMGCFHKLCGFPFFSCVEHQPIHWLQKPGPLHPACRAHLRRSLEAGTKGSTRNRKSASKRWRCLRQKRVEWRCLRGLGFFCPPNDGHVFFWQNDVFNRGHWI